MTGHRKPVYGIKFGLNSNNLASISCDKTLKLWDASA
jgi:ribosomal RNA-processing protein 9